MQHPVHLSFTAPSFSRRFSLAVLTVVTFGLLFAGCARSESDPPLIFAAASLADVLTEAAEVYETETGERVEFNFGGSTALANQIARLGSPADGVVFAGQSPLDLLIDEEVIDSGSEQVIARNSLVVVSGSGQPLAGLLELEADGVSIAIADPDFAPAGQYAREALSNAGLWETLEDRIVPTIDVRAALAAVNSGSVDFAIVYKTDALTGNASDSAFEVAPALHQPVVYPAAGINGSERVNAVKAFIQFLMTAEAQQIFERHRFSAA